MKIDELVEILLELKSGKCLPTPSIPDVWYKNLAKSQDTSQELLEQISHLRNTTILSKVPSIFHMKLIALNQKHPFLPTSEDIRPIFATTATFKVLEKRFTQDLVEFYKKRGDGSKFQVGFIPGLSTQANLLKLAQIVRSAMTGGKPVKERTIPFIMFFDFHHAYNAINLNRTFGMMIVDGYPENDIKFMKWFIFSTNC